MNEIKKIFTYDFWLSPLNLRNNIIHIIVGALIFFFMWFETIHNIMLSWKVLLLFALTIEIVQWVQRDFRMNGKWADSIRDFFTYLIIPGIFYFVRYL